jgi:hypothetical protein
MTEFDDLRALIVAFERLVNDHNLGAEMQKYYEEALLEQRKECLERCW